MILLSLPDSAFTTTTQNCINDRAVLLTDVYSDLIAGVTDAKEFAQQMGSRWATDIRYAEKLINHMDNFNLYRLDTMTVEDYEEYQNSHSDPVKQQRFS